MAIKGFEGGQMPLYQRLPKRGFVKPNRKAHAVVNLGLIQKFVDEGKIDAAAPITEEVLVKSGLVRRRKDGIRVLAKGAVTSKARHRRHRRVAGGGRRRREGGRDAEGRGRREAEEGRRCAEGEEGQEGRRARGARGGARFGGTRAGRAGLCGARFGRARNRTLRRRPTKALARASQPSEAGRRGGEHDGRRRPAGAEAPQRG